MIDILSYIYVRYNINQSQYIWRMVDLSIVRQISCDCLIVGKSEEYLILWLILLILALDKQFQS